MMGAIGLIQETGASAFAIWAVRVVVGLVVVGVVGFAWSVIHQVRQRRAVVRMSKR